MFAIDEGALRVGGATSGRLPGAPVMHERWPDVPRIALTATANQATSEEIVIRPKLAGAEHVVSRSTGRTSSSASSRRMSRRSSSSPYLRPSTRGRGTAYCLSRDSTEKVAAFSTRTVLPRCPIMRGLKHTRAENQARFLREDGLLMVPTIAFGMGSTSRTRASSRTWTCRGPVQGTTRRPAGPAGTGGPSPPGSTAGSPTWCSSGADRRLRGRPRAPRRSPPTWMRCSRCARPPTAVGRSCSRYSPSERWRANCDTACRRRDL